MLTNNTATIFENISKAEAISPTTLNGLPGMSSLEIAEITGKNHKHVLRDIFKMLGELDLIGQSKSGPSSFVEVGSLLSQRQYVETSYRNSQNKAQPLTILDKELTFTLLSRYSFKLSNMIVKRWLELEGSGFERVSVQAAVVHLIEHERCDWKALKAPHKNTQKGLKAAVAKGNLSAKAAAELGLKTR